MNRIWQVVLERRKRPGEACRPLWQMMPIKQASYDTNGPVFLLFKIIVNSTLAFVLITSLLRQASHHLFQSRIWCNTRTLEFWKNARSGDAKYTRLRLLFHSYKAAAHVVSCLKMFCGFCLKFIFCVVQFSNQSLWLCHLIDIAFSIANGGISSLISWGSGNCKTKLERAQRPLSTSYWVQESSHLHNWILLLCNLKLCPETELWPSDGD